MGNIIWSQNIFDRIKPGIYNKYRKDATEYTVSHKLIVVIKITAFVCRLGGYFCDLLLLPIAYPRPNAVHARLITASRLSIVNIGHNLFRTRFPDRVSM